MQPFKSTSSQGNCTQSVLISSLSPYAELSGHQPYTDQQILTAMTGKRKYPPDAASKQHLEAFPAPLVLPGDAIDLDPKYPSQSFNSWMNLGVRNHVTARRKAIYIAAPPAIDKSVKFMEAWARADLESSTDSQATEPTNVDVQGVISYLQAFYHELEVKLLPTTLAFTSWDDSPKLNPKSKAKTKGRKKYNVQAIALSTSTEAIRVRVRPTPPPDSESTRFLFPYSHQLNLNDLTDVALSVLPSDAYALLLLTVHDMYESDDDDFCCGRAWGASRVAIVSSARYEPLLDGDHDIDREHVWPASHCKDFVEK